MQKTRKCVHVLILCLALCIMLYPCLGMSEQTNDRPEVYDTSNSVIETRGLYTNIALYMEGENGAIRAWAKNLFTLFPAVIRLDVELYSSDIYESTYTRMELEKRASTPDLDQGHILEVKVPTNGEQKYWRARVFYRMDAGQWHSMETNTLLYSPDGEVIGL